MGYFVLLIDDSVEFPFLFYLLFSLILFKERFKQHSKPFLGLSCVGRPEKSGIRNHF
jgi:uncharacterized membrane protein